MEHEEHLLGKTSQISFQFVPLSGENIHFVSQCHLLLLQLCSFFLLREKVSLVQGLAVAVAFGGSLLIVKPTGFDMETFPAIIGFLGGAFSGISYTMVRVLGKKGVRGPFIIFFFSTFSCAVTLPAADVYPLEDRLLVPGGITIQRMEVSV